MVRTRSNRLFLDRPGAHLGIEFDDPEALRIVHLVAEHGRTDGAQSRALQHVRQALPEKEVVAQDEADRIPGDELLAASKTDKVKAAYQQNIQDALKADAFGSPCYVLDGEVFWGQDRIELLADALTSGRKPYRSDV